MEWSGEVVVGGGMGAHWSRTPGATPELYSFVCSRQLSTTDKAYFTSSMKQNKLISVVDELSILRNS